MMFKKVQGTLTCTKCGSVKAFEADSDVYATSIKDSEEIQTWTGDRFSDEVRCFAVLLEGLCPDCKYNKAA